MKVVVFGASGATGKLLVAQALERGHEVTAFLRTPSKLEMRGAALRFVQGSVGDAAAVRQAVMGSDAVLSALGTARRFRHDGAVIDGIRNIVGVMTRDGPARLVYLSGLGVRQARSQCGFVFRALSLIAREEIADHETKEDIIRPSGLDWTFVRPPILTLGPRTGNYRHGTDVRTRAVAPMLSRADVAEFMLNQLSDRTYLRKAVAVMH